MRTSIILDESTRRAARALAHRFGCSMSEAIRRAVVSEHDRVAGLRADLRGRRRRALTKLFGLFEDNDADEEIRRLKREDSGF